MTTHWRGGSIRKYKPNEANRKEKIRKKRILQCCSRELIVIVENSRFQEKRMKQEEAEMPDQPDGFCDQIMEENK